MGAFSVSHWLIVLVVVLLLFGPKKLAGIGKGMGEGLRNFRTGLSGDAISDEQAPNAPKEQPAASDRTDSRRPSSG